MKNDLDNNEGTICEKDSNYLDSNSTNLTVYDLLGQIIDQVGVKLDWDSRLAEYLLLALNESDSNPMSDVVRLYSDLQSNYKFDSEHAQSAPVNTDTLQTLYIKPLKEIAEYLEDDSLKKRINAVADRTCQ